MFDSQELYWLVNNRIPIHWIVTKASASYWGAESPNKIHWAWDPYIPRNIISSLASGNQTQRWVQQTSTISPLKAPFMRDFHGFYHIFPWHSQYVPISCREFPWISNVNIARRGLNPVPTLAALASLSTRIAPGQGNVEILSIKLSKHVYTMQAVNRSFLSHKQVLRTLWRVDSMHFSYCVDGYVGVAAVRIWGCLSPKRPLPFSRGWWMTANVLVGSLSTSLWTLLDVSRRWLPHWFGCYLIKWNLTNCRWFVEKQLIDIHPIHIQSLKLVS